MGIWKEREGYFFSNKDLVRLVIPLVVEQLLAILVGLADTVMVSSAGEAAVSGVSLVDTIFILLINIFAALATGGAVVSGQFIGKKKMEDGCRAANQMVLFTAALSVVVMIALYLMRTFILHTVFGKIDADVMHNSEVYLLIVTASIPFIALYNAGAAVFRAMGNTRIAMRMSLLMNGMNIIGNAILLYGFHMGVEGVAIPTLVSRMFAGAVMIVLLFSKKYPLHLAWPIDWHFDRDMLKRILHIGVPNGLENSMFQLGKILVMSMVAGCGTASIAANAVSNSVACFQNLPGMAMGYAILTVCAQCAGAGDFEQVRYYTKKLMAAAYVLIAIFTVAVILALPVFLGAYGISQEAYDMARKILIYHGCCCVAIWSLSFVLPNTLRACNDVRFCMWLSIFSMWVFRICLSWLLCVKLDYGVFGVWVAMTIDWAVRSIFFVWRYLSGRWTRKLVS